MELRYATDRTFIENDEDPGARIYVRSVSELRRRHEDYLILGKFQGQEGLSGLISGVKAAVFARADGRKAIALWNDTDDIMPVSVCAEGFEPDAWASVDGDGDGRAKSIGPGEILLLYQK